MSWRFKSLTDEFYWPRLVRAALCVYPEDMRTSLIILASVCIFNFSCQSHRKTTEVDDLFRYPATPKRSLDSFKKTVCSLTLNSEDEVATFKKHLPSSQFQFVELFNHEDWLERLESRDVVCDILILSGHFAGSFFGQYGKISLSNLEIASCSAANQSIFHHPKEVFLFGCNTLAKKEADHRSPHDYVQVLLESGLAPQEAEQISAFRYSPLGQSFADKMRNIFAGVPRIYGFESVAPLGIHIKPLLEDYLQRKGNYSDYLDSLDLDQNIDLMKSLRSTSASQVSGFENVSIPRCTFVDPQVSTSKKIELIDTIISNPKTRLLHLSEINDYLINNTRSPADRKKEIFLQTKWYFDQDLKKDFLSVYQGSLMSYPILRLQLIDLAVYIGWLPVKDYPILWRSSLKSILRNGLDQKAANQLVSIGGSARRSITYDDLAPYLGRVPNRLIYQVVGEAQLEDSKLQLYVIEASLQDADSTGIGKMIKAQKKTPEVVKRLLAVALTENNPRLRGDALAALGHSTVMIPEIRVQTLKSLSSDSSDLVRKRALYVIESLELKDVQAINALEQTHTRDSSPELRRLAQELLKSLVR